jgi:orotate phosphoribosyltransferase
MLQPFQREFIEFALRAGVLRFGQFTLKSGRVSPYFFNTGLFDTGACLAKLGSYYAQAMTYFGLRPDVLYGPAYKGIPLVCACAMSFSGLTGEEAPFAFNRKEAKDHGEGGQLVGAALKGRVLIVDDVVTAGTSVRESVEIIRSSGAEPCGVLIALDRQEKGKGELSAVQEIRREYGFEVFPVVGMALVMEYLQEQTMDEELRAMADYRARYGVEKG